MSTVKWKYSKEYTVINAVPNEVLSQVTAVAINHEQLVLSAASSFLLCTTMKRARPQRPN
jgi:hypothetical protein